MIQNLSHPLIQNLFHPIILDPLHETFDNLAHIIILKIIMTNTLMDETVNIMKNPFMISTTNPKLEDFFTTFLSEKKPNNLKIEAASEAFYFNLSKVREKFDYELIEPIVSGISTLVTGEPDAMSGAFNIAKEIFNNLLDNLEMDQDSSENLKKF